VLYDSPRIPAARIGREWGGANAASRPTVTPRASPSAHCHGGRDGPSAHPPPEGFTAAIRHINAVLAGEDEPRPLAFQGLRTRLLAELGVNEPRTAGPDPM
jgi:hypothetical protein